MSTRVMNYIYKIWISNPLQKFDLFYLNIWTTTYKVSCYFICIMKVSRRYHENLLSFLIITFSIHSQYFHDTFTKLSRYK